MIGLIKADTQSLDCSSHASLVTLTPQHLNPRPQVEGTPREPRKNPKLTRKLTFGMLE